MVRSRLLVCREKRKKKFFFNNDSMKTGNKSKIGQRRHSARNASNFISRCTMFCVCLFVCLFVRVYLFVFVFGICHNLSPSFCLSLQLCRVVEETRGARRCTLLAAVCNAINASNSSALVMPSSSHLLHHHHHLLLLYAFIFLHALRRVCTWGTSWVVSPTAAAHSSHYSSSVDETAERNEREARFKIFCSGNRKPWWPAAWVLWPWAAICAATLTQHS